MIKNIGLSQQLNKEEGFTLIEIIVVISIIAIAAGLSGYGLSVITQSNVESMGHDIITEFRDLKYRSVSEYDKEYEFRFIYEGGKFGYTIYQSIGGATATEVKKKTYRSDLIIQAYDDGSSLYVDVGNPSFDITDLNRITYTFNTSTGGIDSTSLSGGTLTSLPNAGSTAKYYITDTSGSNFIEITIIGVTGRVIVNEL